jgi:ABC-2 type transport system permease protein
MATEQAAAPRFTFAGDLRLLGRQVGYASRAYRRNPQVVFFGLLFPLLFLAIFATLLGDEDIDELNNLAFNQYYVPRVLALAVMGAAYVNLAVVVCTRRDRGEFKQLRATPLPAWVFLGELVVTAVIAIVALVVTTLVVGVLAYDVTFPDRYAALALTVLVGAGGFAALGLGVASLLPNGDAALAAVNGTFYPLTFVSGTFFLVPADSILSRIAAVFPVKHMNEAVFAAFDPTRTDAGFAWGHLAVVVAWGVVGALVAARRFRWDPVSQ